MEIVVAGRGDSGPPPRRERRARTPVRVVGTAAFFTAPVTVPGGPTREEVCQAMSTDDLWRYDRVDEPGTPWTATFLPTGQVSAGHTSLTDAREATADGSLLQRLRAHAAHVAFTAPEAERRARGQRWLSIHLRLAGAMPTVYARCLECSGRVTVIDQGRLGHLDSCDACQPDRRRPAALPCPAGSHPVCSDPRAGLTNVQRAILDMERRSWRRSGAKTAAIRSELGLSEARYYQMLNDLLDHPEAWATAPALVKRLRAARERRTRI